MTTRGSGIANSMRVRRGHKERSKNFTELEKRTVLELIARHRDVLRQGRSNNATNRSKQLVWSTICDEVNSRCGGDRPRTPAQVKMWYENYKKKCKMRATDTQQQQESSSLLDGMLWQNVNPLDIKEDDIDGAGSVEGSHHSVKDDDCHPLNMSNGRLSSNNDSDDTMTNVLEPQVKIVSHSPSPTNSPLKQPLAHHIPPILLNPGQQRLHPNLYMTQYNEIPAPLNLSHLDDKRNGHEKKETNDDRKDFYKTSDEEKLYFSAKRQHAIWEHEAKMKILNMELKQKEELFLIQKQLFLIELRLKMEFYEKATASPGK